MTTATFRLSLTLLISLTLSACGGGSGGAVQSDSVKRGVFLDSAVEGLEYQSGSLAGLTNGDGSFEYTPGQTVSFYIGDVLLGSAQGSAVLTPLDLVPTAIDASDQKVVNMLRLLQTLDDDGDASNGIVITEVMRDLAEGLTIDLSQSIENFANDGAVQSFVSELTAASNAGARVLIDMQAALDHFLLTLAELEDGGDQSGGGSSSDGEFNFTLTGADTSVTGTQFNLPDIQHILVELNGARSLSLIASRFLDNPGQFVQQGVSFAAGVGDISPSNSLIYTAAIQINVNGDSYQYKFEGECFKPCSTPPFAIDESNRTVTLNNLPMVPDEVPETAQTGPVFMTGTLSWTPADEG